jgi:hypothetical protein
MEQKIKTQSQCMPCRRLIGSTSALAKKSIHARAAGARWASAAAAVPMPVENTLM